MQQVSDHLALCIGSNLPKSNYVARAFKPLVPSSSAHTLTDFKSPKESQFTFENQLFEGPSTLDEKSGTDRIKNGMDLLNFLV